MADWSCTSCTYLNKSTATSCTVCGVDRPRPGGDRPHLEDPSELKKIALELTPLVINPPSPRSLTPGGPNTPRSKTVNLSEKVKVACPFCTIEQGVNIRDIQIKCYMCDKTFPNPLMADGGGVGGGSPSPRNPSPRFDRPKTLTLSPKSQFDRPPSFDREPSRIASPSFSQQAPQQQLLINPHHHHQSSFSQPQPSPSHHHHHSSFSVSPQTPVHGHQNSVSLNTVNVKCPKCGTVMSVPQGSSMVQCPNCQSPLSRSPTFEQQQPFLQPQRVVSTPSPRHSQGLGPQQPYIQGQQQQQPMIPRIVSAPLSHPSPGGGYVSVPQVPRPLTPVQQPQPPQPEQGGVPRQRVTVGAGGDDLPPVAHELEVDLTPDHYSPLNHPAYGKLGAIQKLKFCYLYLGGLILFFYSLASNAVFLNNVPAIIHNYHSVNTLLEGCCTTLSPNNRTNDSFYCCGSTLKFTCCDCMTWVKDAETGPCPDKNEMCERFYESLIPSPPLGLKTVLSYDPFSKCHPAALSTHYKCPDESCLSSPPAIYIYGFNVAYAMLITSQVLLVISRIFTEILYYNKSYKTEQYHATESILGCFWFCRNKHYQNFILEEKMKYEISCIGFWLGVCVRIDNLVTHIFLVGAYASPYFKNSKLILAIVSVFVDVGQIVFDALGFFFQCCAKSCKRGEEHVDCRCKGRNCLEFSFLISLIIGSGVVLAVSFGRLYAV